MKSTKTMQVKHFEKNAQPLWVYKNQKIFYKDVENYQDKISLFLASIHQKRIAAYISNPLTLAKIIVLSQGQAMDVLLIPANSEKELIYKLISQAKTNIIVTDTQIEAPIEVVNITKQAHAQVNMPKNIVETNWIIPTSGTTSSPKLVPHTLASLTRTVNRDTKTGATIIWGTFYDVARFAGLQVFLQSLFGGSSLVFTDNALPLEKRLSILIDEGVNALSGTPTMWRKVLTTKQATHLSLKQITLGGEIVDDMILKALRTHFPLARITHIYASTEAGVGFSVNDGQAGFPVEFLKKHQIKIDNDGVMYLNDGIVRTGDLVEKRGNRYYFLGRESGAINIGGNKVIPEEVEQIILMYPGVKFVKVSSKKSAITGEIVVATIETSYPGIDQKELKTKLISFCRQHLENFKVPALIKIENFSQITSTGKIKRDKQ